MSEFSGNGKGENLRHQNLVPHPEFPIKMATFNELDSVIRDTNETLGITPSSRREAVSDLRGLSVAVSRFEDMSAMRALTVTLKDDDSTIRITARNDAGADDDPYRAAATMTILNKDDRLTEKVNMEEGMFWTVLQLVKARSENGSFQAQEKNSSLFLI